MNVGLAGFSAARRQGRLDGPRRRLLQGDRGGRTGRRQQGQVRADDRQGALHRPAVGRDRRAGPQHDLDAAARHSLGPQLRRRQLLRRPGLHGEEVARREDRQGAQRRHRLRADRHHDRTQPRRLLPRQQHASTSRWCSRRLDETLQAYLAGRCDGYTTDQSGLYSVRVQQAKPDDHMVLPEIISKEPLGPSVRQGD